MKPRQPPDQHVGTVPIPSRCGEALQRSPRHKAIRGEGFRLKGQQCPLKRLFARSVVPPIRSRPATRARPASARSRCPTTTRRSTRRAPGAGSRPARRRSGATRTSCPFDEPPRTALAAGVTPLVRADRLAERLGLGEVWVKNDAANPTHSFKDRVVTVALAKARELGYDVVACASTGNLANAVAAHAAAAGLESYVFIPPTSRSRRSSPPACTAPTSWPCAATTTTSTGSAPSWRASATGRS